MYPFFNHVSWNQSKGPQRSAKIALEIPQLASEESAAGIEINKFFAQVKQDYESIVNRHMVGDCLIYQGKKKRCER